MKNHILYFVLVLLFSHSVNSSHSQITRGAQAGEIYISTEWYIDNFGDIHYAIFHSTNNGEDITLKYENIEVPPPDEMQVGKVLGDATSGALYNYSWEGLWVSFDFGESWEYKENEPIHTKYLSGQVNGLIFKIIGAELSQSVNYGNSFSILTNPINCPIREPGYNLGEFYGINGDVGIALFLDHTYDYANTYTELPIDSSVAFHSIGGYFPQISRGTEAGELYLVSWWLDYHYKIFHSVDSGYTWVEKYESDFIDQYFWEVIYTAGRQPGSFYVMRTTVDPSFNHRLLYIDYSIDYGETFTTYFHDLDSTITSLGSINQPDFKLSNHPNPFSKQTNIVFELPDNCKNPVLFIRNIHGQIIRQFNITRQTSVQWDGRDENGKVVSAGVYFYNTKFGNFTSQSSKVLFMN